MLTTIQDPPAEWTEPEFTPSTRPTIAEVVHSQDKRRSQPLAPEPTFNLLFSRYIDASACKSRLISLHTRPYQLPVSLRNQPSKRLNRCASTRKTNGFFFKTVSFHRNGTPNLPPSKRRFCVVQLRVYSSGWNCPPSPIPPDRDSPDRLCISGLTYRKIEIGEMFCSTRWNKIPPLCTDMIFLIGKYTAVIVPNIGGLPLYYRTTSKEAFITRQSSVALAAGYSGGSISSITFFNHARGKRILLGPNSAARCSARNNTRVLDSPLPWQSIRLAARPPPNSETAWPRKPATRPAQSYLPVGSATGSCSGSGCGGRPRRPVGFGS